MHFFDDIGKKIISSLHAYEKMDDQEQKFWAARNLYSLASDELSRAGNKLSKDQTTYIINTLPSCMDTSTCDANIMALSELVLETTYEQNTPNVFAKPLVMAMTAAYIQTRMECSTLDVNDFSLPCKILEDLGSKYELTSTDKIELCDYLIETTDPTKFHHYGQTMPFNSFMKDYDLKMKPTSPECLHFIDEKYSEKCFNLVAGYQKIKMDITQPVASNGMNNVMAHGLYYETINNLMRFIQY